MKVYPPQQISCDEAEPHQAAKCLLEKRGTIWSSAIKLDSHGLLAGQSRHKELSPEALSRIRAVGNIPARRGA
nr:hypothetical protein [Sphingomonas pruni]